MSEQSTAPAPLIGTYELAEHLAVTPRSIKNWRVSGRIPFIKISPRCVRYNLADVMRALAQPVAKQ